MFHATVHYVQSDEIAAAGWVAGRRNNHLAVVVDAARSPRRKALAVLQAMTDDEFDELGAELAWPSRVPAQRTA